MNNVFIVILNWNRPNLTIECLKSVKKLLVKDFQLNVVVVDNGSTDDSVKKISNLKSLSAKEGQISNIELIVNKTNIGFAAGNNVGIRYALSQGADYIVILNNDVIVDPVSMIRIIDTAKKIHNLGIASPKIYFAKGYEFHKERYQAKDLGRVIWYAGGSIDWENIYGKTRGVDEVDEGLYDETSNTDYATGTCMLMSAIAIKKAGLFDEKYFMYYEDTDLSVRMKKQGFDVLYIPSAVIWHKVAQSSGIGSELNDYFISRNRMIFGLRYGNLRAKLSLIKESFKLLIIGRKWQKIGIKDFYIRKFGKGNWND